MGKIVYWFKSWGVHVMSVMLIIKSAVVDGEEFVEKVDRILGIKKWIVRRLGDRRHSMSLVTIINGITLAEKDALALSAFMAKLPTYLPAIQKQLGDLKQAEADEKNPVALAADVTTILQDLSTDLSTVVPMITNLLPALKTPPAA